MTWPLKGGRPSGPAAAIKRSRRQQAGGGHLPIAHQEGRVMDVYLALRPKAKIAVREAPLYPVLQIEEEGDSPWSLNLGASTVQIREIRDKLSEYLARFDSQPFPPRRVAEMTTEELLDHVG